MTDVPLQMLPDKWIVRDKIASGKEQSEFFHFFWSDWAKTPPAAGVGCCAQSFGVDSVTELLYRWGTGSRLAACGTGLK
jgi:hypothetical protein